MARETDLQATLRQYWGYDSFRPLQERVVRSLLAGHDTCVVMPTGGGKSLCYQMPAVLSGKTAVVVSPLIALMADQAAQLQDMGIPAAVLNSTLPAGEQTAVMRKACQGRYRLLYLSPERLARPDTIGWLRRVPIAFFAIDEAHCISEWGHEFRPEYRQLSCLRVHFPEHPIAAFTASATRQVRHDILQQLQLRNTDKYIASFHRPNLRYVIHRCESEKAQLSLLQAALETYSSGSVIVYAPTIARVEGSVDFLEELGIPAAPYHGQMAADVRRRNQERWMSDEVRVLVGTIAFGLGINKSSVRAVIHLSLPKSIEQYYQEAGRAGRDGLPSDCVLLWQARDAGLLAHFIEQITDPAERERSWQRYHTIRQFAESQECRHRQICLHFGETPRWAACDACDVCGYKLDWLESAQPAEKNIRTTPIAPAPTARRSLPTRLQPPVSDWNARPINPELHEYLRQWRREKAALQNRPAFVIMHDSSIEALCQIQPASLAELRTVPGFGVHKTATYGPELLQALRQFREGARAAAPKKKARPADETKYLVMAGHTLEEVAKLRGRQLATVMEAVASLVEKGEVEFQPAWVRNEKYPLIEATCKRLGMDKLRRLKEVLPQEITFHEIRLVVAHLRRRQKS
jgi:ATP-dependent DNA helicase RecQ